jgi:hypothetical protein
MMQPRQYQYSDSYRSHQPPRRNPAGDGRIKLKGNKQNELRSILQISITCLILFYLGQFIAYAESPAGHLQDERESETILDGFVTGIVTGKPVIDVTVSIAGQSSVTDAKGRYSIAGLEPGTSRMEITGNSIIPRSLMVEHKGPTSLDSSVKSSDFNNAMFWASAGKPERVRRWQTPPKWVIYSHVLDSDPPKVFDLDNRQYLFKIITRELPEISSFFENPEVELFKGRPNDDPRWTGKKSVTGYILCAPERKGGGNASWNKSGWWIRSAKIRVNYDRSRKVWRHEIGHALGMDHAFDNKKWLPLGVKDPNYEPTKLHQGVFFQEWDKLWLHCVYSGPGPAGNMPPDRDAARFIHGKDAVFVDPDSVFGVVKKKKQK